MSYDWQAHYVSVAEVSDVFLFALSPRLRVGEHGGSLSFFDTNRMRAFMLGKILKNEPDIFSAKRFESDETITLRPLTLEIFRSKLADSLELSLSIEDERELLEFYRNFEGD